MAIKNDENLSLFGQKLLELMGERDCDTPKALAKKLLEAKLVSVNTRGKDIYKNKDNAVGSIEKKIRNHLHADDATCLQGEFVNAYCKFFGCSADYLFGYTNIRTADVELRKICEITGLSEEVITRLTKDAANQDSIYLCQAWSQILQSDLYRGIIQNWQMACEQALLAAQKEVERNKLKEELEKASGPDILDLRADLEGVENAYKSANAAYAGFLFNISRNMSGFVEYSLRPKIELFKKRFSEEYN